MIVKFLLIQIGNFILANLVRVKIDSITPTKPFDIIVDKIILEFSEILDKYLKF